MQERGFVRKMARDFEPGSGKAVSYRFSLDDRELDMATWLEQEITLRHTGSKQCIHCARPIQKTFQQGYCFPCVRRLARCDSCLVKPELCHYDQGTCREPAWGEENCLRPHTVYLANSSGLKVGITRGLDPVGRWIDQGAAQGLAIRTASNRLESGRVEVALKDFVADKTNWRAMLKGDPEPLDLVAERNRLLREHRQDAPGEELPGAPREDAEVVEIRYPIVSYPKKIKTHDFDKSAELRRRLLGIKGQYLLFEDLVLNLRKFGGYELEIEVP